jgi:ATP-dependent Clp protease ATP-binding subunit ClpA
MKWNGCSGMWRRGLARRRSVDVAFVARQWLMERGISIKYGARELKRMVHRHFTQPLATMVTRG